MARYASDWLRYTLKEYAAGEIQSRLRIPASVTKRVARGEAQFSRATRDRLRKMYRRDMTAKLRAAGANKREAQDVAQAVPPEKIPDYLKSYLEYARQIARGNGIPLEHVIRGMRMSDRTIDDWDIYVKERKRERWKVREVRFRDSRGQTRRIRPKGKEH